MVTEFRLSRGNRRTLRILTQRGRESARVLRRAQILLLADKGWKRRVIREATGASIPTINRTKRWYREEGLDAALYDAPKSGRPKLLDAKARGTIIATACSDPPAGHSRWTYELIAQHAPLERKVSGESVRLMMKSEGIKPWREKNVVHSQADTRISEEDV